VEEGMFDIPDNFAVDGTDQDNSSDAKGLSESD
jgi:hypothetical protein